MWPAAETAADFITMASDPYLKVATSDGDSECWSSSRVPMPVSRPALPALSIGGNGAITQLVDRPNVGVRKAPERTLR